VVVGDWTTDNRLVTMADYHWVWTTETGMAEAGAAFWQMTAPTAHRLASN